MLNISATWFKARYFAQNAVLSREELSVLNALDNPGRIHNDDETGFPLHSEPPNNLVGKGSSTARMGKQIEPFLKNYYCVRYSRCFREMEQEGALPSSKQPRYFSLP